MVAPWQRSRPSWSSTVVVGEDFVATSWSSWEKSQDSFLNIGYQLLAISGDVPDALVETAQKQVLNIPLLSDPDLVLMRQMGIVFQSPGKQPLPAPSVYITSPKADILFQHVRPELQGASRQRSDSGGRPGV